MASDVYFTDSRVQPRDSVPAKLKRLLKASGLADRDLTGKFVAIKTHFGENGNAGYMRPIYTRAVAEVIKEAGGIPFATDCSTLYPGMRSDAIGHLACAELNGFTSISAGCPVIIADGIRGNDEVVYPVPQVEGFEPAVTEAYYGRALDDADLVVTLSHAKGCVSTSYAGALKNLAMGGGSRKGKMVMHCDTSPMIIPPACKGCKLCLNECGQGAIVIGEDGKAFITDKCVGCAHCLFVCPHKAIMGNMSHEWNNLQRKMGDYCAAFVAQKECFHIALAIDITPQCDCFPQTDAPLVGNIGMFASEDIIALDQAVADAIDAQPMIPTAALPELYEAENCNCEAGHSHAINPDSDWELALVEAAALGAGTREYTLHTVK